MSSQVTQIGVSIVGSGNIANAHAQALKLIPQVKCRKVFDVSQASAASFAKRYGFQGGAATIEELLADPETHVVHVLTPPDSHAGLLKQIADSGKSVFCEKPVATFTKDLAMLEAISPRSGQALGVNQNFVFYPAFVRLRELLATGKFGRLKHVEVVFQPALKQLAAKQFTHWMFSSPLNLLLEQAVHPLSQLQALAGSVLDASVMSDKVVDLGHGTGFVPSFSANFRLTKASANLRFMVGANYPVWQLTAFCDDGVLSADMVNNVCTKLDRTPYLGALDSALTVSRSSRGSAYQSIGNLVEYGASQLGLRPRSDPFFQSVLGSVRHFYGSLRNEVKLEIDLPFGLEVVKTCMNIARDLEQPLAPASATSQTVDASLTDLSRPLAVVFGGTGFIGKYTIAPLLKRGFRVRVVARGVRNLGPEFSQANVETVRGDIKNIDDLRKLIVGARCVINLAHGGGGADYAQIKAAMVDTAVNMAKICKELGVVRFVHTGSIAGLYLGDPQDKITGSTAPDPMPEKRGDYGRAKAVGDLEVEAACKSLGLEFVLIRPAVVVGAGTPAIHSGLGFTNNDQHVVGWSDGNNAIPFVLGSDCGEAIAAAAVATKAIGKSYNLVGDVEMSARQFVEELAKTSGRPLLFLAKSPRRLWLEEMGKWGIKRVGGRAVPMPSIRDFRSRAFYARFDCSDAKRDLDWKPVADRDEFVKQAILVHSES
jgi:2-alkyl-3-oxoalkanoate reductase